MPQFLLMSTRSTGGRNKLVHNQELDRIGKVNHPATIVELRRQVLTMRMEGDTALEVENLTEGDRFHVRSISLFRLMSNMQTDLTPPRTALYYDYGEPAQIVPRDCASR
jgi:hypothetical protein